MIVLLFLLLLPFSASTMSVKGIVGNEECRLCPPGMVCNVIEGQVICQCTDDTPIPRFIAPELSKEYPPEFARSKAILRQVLAKSWNIHDIKEDTQSDDAGDKPAFFIDVRLCYDMPYTSHNFQRKVMHMMKLIIAYNDELNQDTSSKLGFGGVVIVIALVLFAIMVGYVVYRRRLIRNSSAFMTDSEGALEAAADAASQERRIVADAFENQFFDLDE